MAESLGHGRYRVGDRLAYAVAERGRTWVFLDGRTYIIETSSRRGAARGRAADDEVALAAPMPATVAAISVVPGQDVRAGDLLVMLEAMKMELPIAAPRDGRVKTVNCREGELVQAGVPLVELE